MLTIMYFFWDGFSSSAAPNAIAITSVLIEPQIRILPTIEPRIGITIAVE